MEMLLLNDNLYIGIVDIVFLKNILKERSRSFLGFVIFGNTEESLRYLWVCFVLVKSDLPRTV